MPMGYTDSDIDQLLGHLKSEFGQHGRRAADSLLTARKLLDWAKGHESGAPRTGNAVAYCLREVMTEILKSQDNSGQSWRSVSRQVVDAKENFQRVHQSGADEQRPLTDLLKKIDDLSEFHKRESDRERRLIAVLFDRTGSSPVAGSSSVKKYQLTIKNLNRGVHGSASFGVDQAESTWSECVALLSLMFLPDVRYRELGRLAKIEEPLAENVMEVSDLVISPAHLRYFLARIERPVWLDVLTDSGLLDPPDNGDGWPVFVATERLARKYPSAITHWLNRLYLRISGTPRCASMIGDAALAIGDNGSMLVARIVRQHSTQPDVVRLAWDAARSANPSLDTYESFVDIVFNQQSSSFAWTFGEIAERFVSGIDADNVMRRLHLLRSKIRSTPAHDIAILRHLRNGSIADYIDAGHDERLGVLIRALMRATRAAAHWVDISSLLEFMDTLPGAIGVRMRLWMLGSTAELQVDTLIEEITDAIGQRHPYGDDLPLIDRVVQTVDPACYADRWLEAFGPAPGIEEVGRRLAAGDALEELLRAHRWFPLLPGIDPGPWEDVLSVLAARYPTSGRESLASRKEPTEGEIIGDDSPFSVAELESLSPEEAGLRISGWRPQDGEWLVNARALAKTLERIVINNPAPWVRHPLRVAMALRHPTYIHRYLVAIQATLSEDRAPVDELIRLISFLRTHPWKADMLGWNEFDYDTDWENVDRITIDIVKSLAKENFGFAGLSNDVWRILESAVKAYSATTESEVPVRQDPLDIAINLPWTQALAAALEFVGFESRSSNCVRFDAFRLLSETLRLDGASGLYHRAIIAPYIGLLRHVAPEWVESNRNLLFGNEAPTGLGRKTLDQALKWAPPDKWLLETFRCGVMDAVGRRVRNALGNYLIAMLWDWHGYSLEEAATFLGSQPALLSAAGKELGSMLDRDSAKSICIERSIGFWETMIDRNQRGAGLTGFGGFARVGALDDARWCGLTLKTLRRTGGCIDESHMVAERTAGLGPDDTTLEIMDSLVRKSFSRTQSDGERNQAYHRARWRKSKVEEAARKLLDRSSDLESSDHYQRLRTALLERRTAV